MTGHQGRTTRGLTLRKKILSRVSIRAQHALPPRKNGGDRDRAVPSLFFRKRASEEASSEDARERFLKGAVTTTLALTQVMGSALATDAVLVDRAGELKNAAIAESSAETTEREASLVGASLVAPSVTTNEGEETDLYRDTILRYAGYANEVGESFKNIVSRTSYRMSYAVAICYVLADAADKGMKADEAIAAEAPSGQVDAGMDSAKSPKVEIAKAAFDTLVWQGLASVIIPGYTINRIVWAAKKLTDSVDVPMGAKKWAPTIIGLSFIPFIVHPIDSGVTTLMDATLRKFL